MTGHYKERERQSSVLPAYSSRSHIYLPWQAGYHKADYEPQDPPSHRSANSRNKAVERAPHPTGAQPSQSMK
jgi:hypothetical protein